MNPTEKAIIEIVPTLDERARGRIMRAILAECESVMPGKTFRVKLVRYVGAKIAGIKALRAVMEIGLADAKAMMDQLPEGTDVEAPFPVKIDRNFGSRAEADAFITKINIEGKPSNNCQCVIFASIEEVS